MAHSDRAEPTSMPRAGRPAQPVSCSQGLWPVSPWLGLETGSPGPLRALVHVCVCVCETDRQTDGQPLGTHSLGSVCDGVCKSECPAHPAWWLSCGVVCLSVWLGVCVRLCLSCDIMSAWVD